MNDYIIEIYHDVVKILKMSTQLSKEKQDEKLEESDIDEICRMLNFDDKEFDNISLNYKNTKQLLMF